MYLFVYIHWMGNDVNRMKPRPKTTIETLILETEPQIITYKLL